MTGTLTAADVLCDVFTFKAGALAAAGHDLKLRAQRIHVELDEAAGTVDARIDARSLAAVCAMQRGRERRDQLDAGDRRKIDEATAADVLLSAQHPEIRFVGKTEKRQAHRVRLRGVLTIRGRERSLLLEARRDSDCWVAEATVHQPDFGIEPFRALFGALRLQPDVIVRVSVPARKKTLARRPRSG